MLKVNNLCAGYGKVQVLWNISLEVKDGQVVAVLGSNGAGKTTTVRTITGMVKASSGSVIFNGEELADRSSRFILDQIIEVGIYFRFRQRIQCRRGLIQNNKGGILIQSTGNGYLLSFTTGQVDPFTGIVIQQCI